MRGTIPVAVVAAVVGAPRRSAAYVGDVALSSGVHPKVGQERLGHSSIAITLDRYSHVIKGMDREAAETMAGLIR